MAAVTAVLAQYSEDIVTRVTHPVTGLPTKKSWLPTVKEVYDACEEAAAPAVRQQERDRIVAETLAERDAIEAARGQVRPTMEQLKEKYGPNWGLSTLNASSKAAGKSAPSWDEIVKIYTVEPGRINHLSDMHKHLRDDESRAEGE